MSYFYGSIDAESATEGVPHPNFRYGRLGDIFVVHKSRENPRKEGIVAVVWNRTLTGKESVNEKYRIRTQSNEPTCRYASREILGVMTWCIVAVNGRIAKVTLCNFPSPGMVHLPSMMYETDVTSFAITTVSLGWYGYCGGSDELILPRLRRRGLGRTMALGSGEGVRLPLRLWSSSRPGLARLPALLCTLLSTLLLPLPLLLLLFTLLLLLLLLLLRPRCLKTQRRGLRLRYMGLIGRIGLLVL